MEKINAKTEVGYQLTYGENEESHFLSEEVISELGVLGWYLGEEGKLLENHNGGYLLRTKLKNENEGGIMHGSSVLNSIIY